MLISHFGDSICFTYPKDRKQSQMFFSANIKSVDIAETLRTGNSMLFAEHLREEAKSFDFGLEGSFCSAEDVEISDDIHSHDRPQLWEKFFDTIFPYRTKSKHIQRKCDVIFQIIYFIMHNGQKQTPLHISLAELIHDNARSKILVQILNKLGLCISYDEMEKIDLGLAKRIVDTVGLNRVPVSSSMQNSVLIHGAMDNFDHDERTSSGIGGSHDTILMLFQNEHGATEQSYEISKNTDTSKDDQRTFSSILPCQKLLRSGSFGRKGKIPDSFVPGQKLDFSCVTKESTRDHRLWVLARHLKQSNLPTPLINNVASHIPSYASMKSLVSVQEHTLTRCAFTPILPYPATEEDSIFTTMVNFQES